MMENENKDTPWGLTVNLMGVCSMEESIACVKETKELEPHDVSVSWTADNNNNDMSMSNLHIDW